MDLGDLFVPDRGGHGGMKPDQPPNMASSALSSSLPPAMSSLVLCSQPLQ
ncbi:hypothetical protein RchiOBHm_Chr7g0233281 [Rosa chinensis]|uniref:Uncharacterized protein n=2 Tax=Rosa chinensis TaxID=74649 RepID=A0A2P6PG63_ROSCH|nr:hypothetical protein RchiOBHm_Chr7g0233281 [Rosa chinensis]